MTTKNTKTQAAPVQSGGTPGPWTAELIRPADGSTQAFHWWIHGAGNWTVCELPASIGTQPADRTANARLIAAAPALLAALQRLLDCPDLNFDEMEPESIQAMDQARAAIAQAKGAQ